MFFQAAGQLVVLSDDIPLRHRQVVRHLNDNQRP